MTKLTKSGRAPLLRDLRGIIATAHQTVARGVNTALVDLYWRIGTRIRTDILANRRAGYGQQIVGTLGRQLAKEFGAGFDSDNLHRMIQFAEAYPDERIVGTLCRQLSWSQFRILLPLKDPLQRDFYTEMCRVEGWSVRQLRDKISGMLFERTALSKRPARLIRREIATLRAEGRLTPDLVFKDPYVLDFLGLRDTFSEKDLETALLREIERFILELGEGFAFVERQKRITIDGEDFHLDLLFYHRRLRRLVLVELKLGAFQAADFGQIQLYLSWLDRHERQPAEASPLGLILCAEKSSERIELLQLEKTGVRVAQYLTGLPPRKMLERRLHQAVRQARARLEPKGS